MKRGRNRYVTFDGYCWKCYPNKTNIPTAHEKPQLNWTEVLIDINECKNDTNAHEDTYDKNWILYLSYRYVLFRGFFKLDYGTYPMHVRAKYALSNLRKHFNILSNIQTQACDDTIPHIRLKLLYYDWVLKQFFPKDLRRYIFHSFIIPKSFYQNMTYAKNLLQQIAMPDITDRYNYNIWDF